MVLVDGAGTPLGIHVEKASPAEVKLLEPTLDSVQVRPRKGSRHQPERLIGDRAYDSNAARTLLLQRHIEPIIPARSNNRIATHQDSRKLRRYQRRWIVERTNSWLQNFRRLVVRYEYHAANFQGFVHLAAAIILLRYL
jgi:transposase